GSRESARTRRTDREAATSGQRSLRKRFTMRMLMKVSFPVEPFNAAVRDGSVGAKMQAILEDIRPEAAYFYEDEGRRGGILIVDLPNPSRVPALAEPWFLTFNAKVEFKI